MLQDIAKKYLELYPAVGESKAYLDAKYQLSKLYREKKIIGRKVKGKKGYMFSPLPTDVSLSENTQMSLLEETIQ